MRLRQFGLVVCRMSFLALLLMMATVTTACDLGESVNLTGLGASLPAPLYQNWAVGLNQLHPHIRVNYQSQGSGAGIENFIRGNVDFAASDLAMRDEEMAQVPQGVLLLPMTAGSIVLAYHLPGVPEGLKLSREVYVGILSGQIRRWNDPHIVALNPGINLPDQGITVVHRADGSGTTAVLTRHLSAISPQWQENFGEGTTIQWPTTGNFVGAKGNEGVTARIQQIPGAIGYVEYSYARSNQLATAALENKAGNYVMATPEAGAAALAAVTLPANLRAFISDPEGKDAYPLVTYTWQLQYQHQPDARKAVALEMWIEYGLNAGQKVAAALGYIPLPQAVRKRIAQVADTLSDQYTITLQDD